MITETIKNYSKQNLKRRARALFFLKIQSKVKYLNSQTDTTYAVLYFVLCASARSSLSKLSIKALSFLWRFFGVFGRRRFSPFFNIKYCLFKLPRNPRNPRENSPCFYRVIETRVFELLTTRWSDQRPCFWKVIL